MLASWFSASAAGELLGTGAGQQVSGLRDGGAHARAIELAEQGDVAWWGRR